MPRSKVLPTAPIPSAAGHRTSPARQMSMFAKVPGRRSVLQPWSGPWWAFWRRAAPKIQGATVRGLWSLPKAAPALMRHIGAYVELVGLDLAKAQREITAQVVVLAIAAVCGLFAAFMACLVVIAITWDTPYRVAAIAWMCGGFLAVAIGAG